MLLPSSPVRYSGLSVAYMLSGLLGSALTPAITTWLLSATGQSDSIAYYIAASAGLSLVALFLLRDNHKRDIDRVGATTTIRTAA